MGGSKEENEGKGKRIISVHMWGGSLQRLGVISSCIYFACVALIHTYIYIYTHNSSNTEIKPSTTASAVKQKALSEGPASRVEGKGGFHKM